MDNKTDHPDLLWYSVVFSPSSCLGIPSKNLFRHISHHTSLWHLSKPSCFNKLTQSLWIKLDLISPRNIFFPSKIYLNIWITEVLARLTSLCQLYIKIMRNLLGYKKSKHISVYILTYGFAVKIKNPCLYNTALYLLNKRQQEHQVLW